MLSTRKSPQSAAFRRFLTSILRRSALSSHSDSVKTQPVWRYGLFWLKVVYVLAEKHREV